MQKNEILLEHGTNEVEMIEFGIEDESFGINVLKVREVVVNIPTTPIPKVHPCLEGVIRLRNEIIPVIDLPKFLDFGASPHPGVDKYIIAEMNGVKVALHVHHVSRIHRVSWRDIEKPNQIVQGEEPVVVGIVRLQQKLLILLDFEKIITEMAPSIHKHHAMIQQLGDLNRSDRKVMIVEDSSMLMNLLVNTLYEAGYTQLTTYTDGLQAWQALEQTSNQDQSAFDMVITDIEIPQMDGLHLTRRIKENPRLKEIPVIIFSSLITDDLRHKGDALGANAQINKPKIHELVHTMDRFF